MLELSEAAARDIEDILDQSIVDFGVHQTERYFESLGRCLDLPSTNPRMGASAEEIRPDYRRFTHNAHVIFYRQAVEGILVVRLLGMSPRSLPKLRDPRILQRMLTVIETPTFQKLADVVWSEDERLEFVTWLSRNPLAGDVIPGAKGARKVRWNCSGQGKRSGARIIYFSLSAEGVLYLITLYRKSEQANIKSDAIKRAIE